MADPTPLSPAAQAVLSAFGYYSLRASHVAEDLIPALAAALRALAACVEPVEIRTGPGMAELDEVIRASDILAIAAELEAGQ